MTNGNLVPEEERGFQMKPELKGLLYPKEAIDKAYENGRRQERKEIVERLSKTIMNLKHCHTMLRSARKDIAGLAAIDLEMKLVLTELESLSNNQSIK